MQPPFQGSDVGQITIGAQKTIDGLKVGDSIAINGACLTVVSRNPDSFSVELSPETIRRTNLGTLQEGHGVNLERPLTLIDRLGGHIVQGHVDATSKVSSTHRDGNCMIMGFRTPKRLTPYIVEKGFVAVDGISLTVAKRGASYFTASVIPYTLENTVLRERYAGDHVNLEVDILAKYVESFLKS